MTNAVMDDLNEGKVIKSDLSYKVSVYSRGQKVHIDFDCTFDPIKDMVSLAVQGGCKWYKLVKDDSGKWTREEQGGEPSVG